MDTLLEFFRNQLNRISADKKPVHAPGPRKPTLAAIEAVQKPEKQ